MNVLTKVSHTMSFSEHMRREKVSGTAIDTIESWQLNRIWDETKAEKILGAIKRDVSFGDVENGLIISSPMIHVGNPLYKSPKSVCRKNSDYDVIDLEEIPASYVPRTVYQPVLEDNIYSKNMPRVRWDKTKRHTDYYRIGFRAMMALNGERSLVSALLPKGYAHVHNIFSLACADDKALLNLYAGSISLPFDFLAKAASRQNLSDADIAAMPFLDVHHTAVNRALRLACLSEDYSELWDDWAHAGPVWSWSTTRTAQVSPEMDVAGPKKWSREAPLRLPFWRRQAAVEIDVLVAQSMGLSVNELVQIYNFSFPVLQENEVGTWYDREGRIVWTCSRGLPGVGWLNEKGKSPGRAAWEKILADSPSELTCTAIDDTMPGGPREVTRHFVGPFTKCDRIEDYRRAWAHFERLKAEEAA